jgi:hypothetical protein
MKFYAISISLGKEKCCAISYESLFRYSGHSFVALKAEEYDSGGDEVKLVSLSPSK